LNEGAASKLFYCPTTSSIISSWAGFVNLRCPCAGRRDAAGDCALVICDNAQKSRRVAGQDGPAEAAEFSPARTAVFELQSAKNVLH
jgi:hypothetical protein